MQFFALRFLASRSTSKRMHKRPQRKHVYAHILCFFFLAPFVESFCDATRAICHLPEWYVHVLSGECKSTEAIQIVRVNEMVCLALRIIHLVGNQWMHEENIFFVYSLHTFHNCRLCSTSNIHRICVASQRESTVTEKQIANSYYDKHTQLRLHWTRLTIGEIVAHSIECSN